MENFQNFNNSRAFKTAEGPEKKSKLINVGPTSIPDCAVCTFIVLWQKMEVQ